MEYFNSGFTDKSYLNLCKQIVMEIYADRMGKKDISFYFYNKKTINAWTSLLDNGKNCIVINTGMVCSIFALMKTAFSQTDCFENIGDSQEEKNNIIYGKFSDEKLSVNFTGTPNDRLRESISTYASMFAIRFIITHELGHIFNGHTAYLKKMYMNSQICMKEEKKEENDEYSLDRRTLEMDADAAAATSSFDNVVMLYYEHSNEKLIKSLKSREEIFRIWAFSVCSVFMLFEQMATTEYDKYGYYLPNKARFFMIMNAAYETAKAYAKHDIVPELKIKNNEIMDEVCNGVREAEIFFRKMRMKFNWLREFKELDSSYFYFSREVLSNWDNKLRGKLEEYASQPLYNKDNMDEIIKKIKNS